MAAIQIGVLLPIFTWYCVVAIAAYRHGYPFEDMDWNGDGKTTLSEFLEAADVGCLPARDDASCIEYFQYKDGVPFKRVCSGQPQ